MRVENLKRFTNWQEIKDTTMNTVGKDSGKLPDSNWKRRLILAEHSPIRRLKFYWRWVNIKYWVSVHLVRHKIGIEHWVSTQRTDRTGMNRDQLPQNSLVKHACEADAQAMINISRKRLCFCASPETRKAWEAVKDEVDKLEPELASCMVKECVYRGFCPEMFPCGYSDTIQFQNELKNYRAGVTDKSEDILKTYKNNFKYDIKYLVDNLPREIIIRDFYKYLDEESKHNI